MKKSLALLGALFWTICATAHEIRPISYAERAAVQIVANYLKTGPQAVYDELAPTSPLGKLASADALQEIEVRFGPSNAATWELQTVVPALKDEAAVFNVSYPSGADETVAIYFQAENGAFKIRDIRILAEPSAIEPIFPVEAAVIPSAHNQANPNAAPLAAGMIACLLGAAAAAITSRKQAIARALIVVGVLAAGAAAYLVFDRLPKRHEEVAARVEKSTYPRLASLLPFRRAIAAGTDVSAATPPAGLRGVAADVAKLWAAQLDLEQMRVDNATRTLRAEPDPSRTPLTEVLRGRLAFSQAREAESVIAYEHAVNLGPGRDGLWLETAQALDTLGFSSRAESYFRRLSRIGSRDANVYYSLAVLAAMKNNEEDAIANLKTAWSLRPVSRQQLVGTPVLWSTLRNPEIVNHIQLSAAAEATFTSPAVSTRVIRLPEGAQPRVSGDYLDVQIGDAELSVPGGACLAPQGTPIVDAGIWTRSEEQKALADFNQLAPLARNAGSYTQPQLRRRILRCADALAEHNRWADLVQMTDGLAPRSEHVPADLFFLRDLALQRLHRDVDAKSLLLDLAVSPSLRRRNDPQQFVSLGSMLAQADLFDPAVKVLDHAASLKREGTAGIDDLVTRISMNKRLATKYQTYKTSHFEIHFPEDVSAAFAQQMGAILENELKREAKWVTVTNFKTVVVNVVWWRDFRATYTGNDFILGFYQGGKLTIPFAGIPGWYPDITAIMSHELCHAIIAQATNDQAPHWFQEGLAQRVEMVPYQSNAFNMYDDERLLPVSLLDAVLRSSPDPGMISEAYIVSQTIIRFIESAYGQKGIDAMIAAYRDGATTEEAIQRLSGLSVPAFDAKLRAWGRGGTKVFENHEIIDYSQQEMR